MVFCAIANKRKLARSAWHPQFFTLLDIRFPHCPPASHALREHNTRGIYLDGPRLMNPCDLLAMLIDAAQGRLAEQHYAPSPWAQRQQHVTYTGRVARKRRYPTHGPDEFQRELRAS